LQDIGVFQSDVCKQFLYLMLVSNTNDLHCCAWEERSLIKSKEIWSQLARAKSTGTEWNSR